MKRQMRSVLAILLACNLMLNAASAAVFAADRATHENIHEAAGFDYGASLGPAYMTANATADDGGELLESPFGSKPVDNVTLEPVEPEAPVLASAAKAPGLRLVSGEVVASGVCGDNLPWTLAEDDEPAQVPTQAQTVPEETEASDDEQQAQTLPAYAAEPVWDVTTAEDSWFAAPAPRLMSASDSQLEALEKAMRQAVWEGKETFEVDYSDYGITYQELRETLTRLYYAPETFAVDSYMSSNYGSYATVRPVYYSNLRSDYDAAKQDYLDGVNAIIAGIDPGWSDLEKVLYVNDYLCINFAYDNSYQIYDAYGFFKYGVGVCQAYTRVFRGVMDALNIRSSFVDSDSLNHTWNIVQLGDSWYHIDVTWNDPSMVPEHQANHEYFLLSTNAMKAARDHFEQDDWRFGRNVTCSDTRYDTAFWQKSVSPFVPYSDGWLYVSAEGLVRWDADHDSRTILADYGSIFSQYHSSYSFGSYVWRSGLAVRSNKVFFNSWYDVLCYDINTGVTTCLTSLLDEGKNVHSCWIDGNWLIFQSGSEHYNYILTTSVIASGACGDDLTWTLDENGLLTISGTGAMTSSPWRPSYTEDIKTVVIEDGATSIGSYAFMDCSNLTSVTIPDSVGSIGEYAFFGCDNLTSLVIPESVYYIGAHALPDGSTATTSVIKPGYTWTGDLEGARAAHQASSYYNMGVEGLTETIDNLAGALADHSALGVLKNQANFQAVCEDLGIDPATADNETLANAAVFFVADQFGKLDAEAVFNAMVEDVANDSGSTYLNAYLTANDIDPTAKEGLFLSTALWYGVATAYVYAQDSEGMSYATEEEIAAIQGVTPTDLASALAIINGATNGAGYLTYLGEKGQDDLDAFFKFFGVLDANTAGFETISTSNLFSNPDVIAVINSILGDEEPFYIASGSCGDNLTWTLDETGLLTISGTGEMTSSPWQDEHRSDIKTVVINDGVTRISGNSFENCDNLTSVTISNSVTRIGNGAFWGCISLTNVMIPDGTTSISDYAFTGCSSLTSVTIPGSMTRIGDGAFANCSITEFSLDPGNASYIFEDGVLYSKDKTLLHSCITNNSAEFIVPDSVMRIGGSAFEGCSSLTSVTIGAGVTSIGSSAFSGCSSLTSATIPDSLTNIGSFAFRDCNSLASVTIPDCVTRIDVEVFRGCSSLTSVMIPDSVTKIDSSAFYGCSSLTSVTIPDNVTSISHYAFYHCYALTDIYYGGTEADWNMITIGVSNDPLTSATIHYNYVPAPAIIDSGTCGENLTWTLDENGLLTIRGTGRMWNWYGLSHCSPFFYDDRITSVIIEDGVTSIGTAAFEGCTHLASIEIGKDVTYIGSGAFFACDALQSIVIPEGVTSIGNETFKGCISMESVTIPDGVGSVGKYAFYGCSSLEDIDLPDALTYIGENSFSGCSSLTDVTIPYGVTKIDDYAFFNCVNLTNVEIADSVEYIGAYAFYGCNGLTDVTIPDSVTYIGEHAFPDSEQSHILYDGYVWQGDMASVVEAFNDSSFNNIGVDGLTEAVDRLAGVLSDNVAISHLRGMSRFQTTCSKLGVDPYAADRKTLANVAVFFIADMLGQLDAAAVFNAMVEDIIDGGGSSHLDAYLSGEGINVASNEGLFLKTAMSFGLATAYAYAEDTAGNSYATQEEIDYLRGVMPTNLSSTVDIISNATSGDGYISYLGDLGESDLNAFFGVLGLLSENEAGFADVSVPNMFSSLEVRGAIETIINGAYPIEPSNGQCGPQLYWTLDSDRTLTITGTGEMTDAPWLADHAGDISRVVIEDGAASICDDAFNGCENLVGVTIPSSVTVIGVGAFNNCSETIDIHYLGSCVEWNEVEKTDSGAINVRMDEHVFTTEPVWTWNDDLTVAIAGFTCSECGFSEDVVAEIIDHEWLEPTHTADGYRTAIALVDYHDNFYLKNEIRTLPATGHVYGDPVWNWTEEHEAAAVFTCPSDGAQQIIEAVVTTTEVPSTHTVAGALTYTASVEFNDQVYSDEVTEELPLVPHTFGEPVWTWSEDHAAFAVFACECGFEQTIPAEVTVTETVEPTHTTEGWIRYKATVVFNGDASYYDEMLQPLHTTEHVYGEPVWNWEADHTATAVFTCVNCDAQQSIPASVAIIEESPTHADAGSRVYTASVEFNGQSYTDSIAEELPVIPHSFGEPIWTWAEDHSSADMTFACACGYEETVQAEVTAETLEPSHTADGWIKYTATGVFCDDAYTDEQTVVLPSADVHYNLDPFWRWADDGLSAEYVVKCAGCDVETAIEATVTEYGVRIEPTCTENGQVKYYAVARYQGTRVTDTLIVVLPASHVPGEAVHENEVPAACEAEGSYDEVVYCTVCGEELSRESTSILALGHDYVAAVTEPTCTAQGYTIYTCTRCGSSMQEDEVLLGAVNTAFGAACMENMIFDLKTANGAIETTGTEGHLKIATVTASLATAADEPVVIDLTESFMKYFKGNENSEFKLFTAFVYDTVNGGFKGVLPDGSTATMSVTVNGKTYTYTQAAVDAYRSSNYNNAQLIELTNSFDNIATVLCHSKAGLAALANMATFKAELVKLGIIDDGVEITREMLSDAALAKKVSNASVLYVAETISKMDPNQIYDAFVSGNIDTLVEGSGVDSTFVTAILQYGLLTAFVNTENGAVYKADFMEDSKIVTGLASVTNLFNKYTMNEDTGTYYDYQDYINSNAAANDIKGFLSALNIINDNAENFDLSQVYSNEDIIAAVNSILGNDGNENAVHLGSIYITDYTLALGHDYVGVVTEPTCMEQGYTTYICSRCGDTYVANHVPSLGHDWGEWAVTTPATTAAVGEETRTCLRCGAEETRTIEPLGPEQTTVHLNIPAAVAEKIAITQNGQPIFGDAAVDSEGDVTFEVTSEQACIVLIAATNEDGETVYERIEARETEDEGVYLFEATVEEDAEIIVAVRGDINLDGATDLKDAMIVMQSYSQAYIPSELEALVADFDNDGELSLKDAMIVMQVYSQAVDPANLW